MNSEENLDEIEVLGEEVVDRKISEPRERQLLKYVRDQYNPLKFYYPASGFDTLPKEVFGDKCINGTLLESDSYFTESKQNVIADYTQNPFARNSIDAVYLHGLVGQPTLQEGINEMYKLVKPGGHIIWVADDTYEEQQQYLDQLVGLGLKDVTPEEFSKPVGEYSVNPKDPKKGGHKMVIFEKI